MTDNRIRKLEKHFGNENKKIFIAWLNETTNEWEIDGSLEKYLEIKALHEQVIYCTPVDAGL